VAAATADRVARWGAQITAEGVLSARSSYVNPRDFSGDPADGTADDLGPEGLTFVPAAASPSGKPLVIVANEVSGTVSIYELVAQ
jgi:hypothetical protein